MKAVFDPVNKLSGFVAIVKANLSGWYVLLALLFMSLFLSGCDDEVVCPVDEECRVEVTAINSFCAVGAFGTIAFVLDDGAVLEPWINATAITEVEGGARYTIGYTPTKRDDRYKNDSRFENNIICCGMDPGPQAVKITCLTPVAATDI